MTPIIQSIQEVAEILKDAVAKVFETMFEMELLQIDHSNVCDDGELLIIASVGLVGSLNGLVQLRINTSFALTLASQMLALHGADAAPDELIDDVIGEISNVIVGSLQSHLCDSGVISKMTVPTVVRGHGLSKGSSDSSQNLTFVMAWNHELILVELILQPSHLKG
jgi:chemotaxis protein CheX